MYSRYKKDLDYSYTIGAFPTIELLGKRPEAVIEVIYSESATKSNESLRKIQELCAAQDIKIVQNDKIVRKLSQRDKDNVIGIFKKYESGLTLDSNILLLKQPSYTGNLGTIIRTSLGFNNLNIGIIKPAVDIFDPKVIRASMGSIFQINFEYFDSLDHFLQKFRYPCYALDIKGEKLLHEMEFDSPATFLFGNEGAGLSDEELEKCTTVKISQSNRIDSLNLSVSVGILLHQVKLH